LEASPAGNTYLEAQTVTNLDKNSTVTVDGAGALASVPPRPGTNGNPTIAVPPPPAVTPPSVDDIEHRLKSLEDQIAQIRTEVEQLRRER
jgi:hypothetical protein